MSKNLITLIFLFLSVFSSCAQENNNDYQGNWEGILSKKNTFNFNITVEKLKSNSYNITIANDKALINKKVKSISNDHIQINIDEGIHFNLFAKDNNKELTGFIKSGILMYHISLKKTEGNKFTGTWNPFMIDNLQSQSIFLSVENNEDGTIAAYPIFGDQRFSGTWTSNFVRQGNIVSFQDFKTGLKFKATLLKTKIELEVLLVNSIVTKTDLLRSNAEWEFGTTDTHQSQNTNTPPQLNDGWVTANIDDFGINQTELVRLIDDTNSKKLLNTHSVLIAKKGKLVFETYFDGNNFNIPHDLRSASKSISSAMVGIAIDDKVIESVNQKLYDFIPKTYQYTKNSLKSKIKIKDLLTMSSGLNVNGAAEEDNYQSSSDWLKTVLEASMVKEPGAYADYGSANPFLLGVSLNERLEKPLEIYMDQKLFEPLGITNYINQTNNTGTMPYFGGGMYLTSRDMLKFGQLYLNGGKWNGKQIISKKWVQESFKKHTYLQDVKDKNKYGYLWWHHTYNINGKAINSVEARGAGGQYIFVIPELKSVVVITSGNFRNGKTRQPEKILEEYILPAILD